MEKIILSDTHLKNEKIHELKRGDRPDGSEIGTYRSQSYSLFKSSLNPLAGGYVDLILTGSFSNNLFPVRQSNNIYSFDGKDRKTGDLISKYGMDIMGLNQETFNRLQKDLYAPQLIRYIKKKIGQ